MHGRDLGLVRNLYIYPVKSMRGVAVDEISCHWYGANGDRKAAFTQVGDLSGFPWLTGRELPQMLQYEPAFVDATNALTSPIRVRTPQGRDLALESQELREELATLFGAPIALLRLKRGTFDSMPLSLISAATVQSLTQGSGDAAGGENALDPRRFRPNIFLDGATEISEDSVIGATLTFGEREDAARIQIHYPTKRCVMINLHPDNAESNPNVLKRVASKRDSRAGVYATVSRPGMIRRGDRVFVQTVLR